MNYEMCNIFNTGIGIIFYVYLPHTSVDLNIKDFEYPTGKSIFHSDYRSVFEIQSSSTRTATQTGVFIYVCKLDNI